MSALRARLVALGLAGALLLVPLFEGSKPVPYKDPVGIWPDCYGHTGPDVVPGQKNSSQACEDTLDADLMSAYTVVRSCVRVPLNKNEVSAYTSFAYNVGRGKTGIKDGFCVLKNGREPSFLRKLNSGDHTGACLGLLPWDKAGGRVLPGLTKRRTAESQLCLKPELPP